MLTGFGPIHNPLFHLQHPSRRKLFLAFVVVAEFNHTIPHQKGIGLREDLFTAHDAHVFLGDFLDELGAGKHGVVPVEFGEDFCIRRGAHLVRLVQQFCFGQQFVWSSLLNVLEDLSPIVLKFRPCGFVFVLASGQASDIGRHAVGRHIRFDFLATRGHDLFHITMNPGHAEENVGFISALVLRSSNIQNDTLSFNDNVFVDTDIPERIMVRPGDVLICVRNGSRDLIGKSVLLDERTKGMTFGAFMAVYRSSIGKLASYLFQSEILKRQINEHLGATINQITNKSLNSFRIPVPPSDTEQRAITAVLADVDALLANLDQLIAKKRDLKQAAMQQLLTGQFRLPGFGGKWEVKRLGDVLHVCHGKSQHHIAVNNGQYPILATGGEIGRTNTCLYDKPSVLIGRKGTIDKPQYQDEPFWTVDTLFYTELSNTAYPKFIYFSFLMIDWRSYNEASGVPSLNASTIESIEIAIPKYDEQIAIATVLSDMDAEIAALEARRDKTRDLKQGMMQELLTGRIRLV